jgi:SAM-dependent methyltransferase
MKNWFDTWFNTSYYHLLYKDRNTDEAEFFLKNLLTYLKPDKQTKFLDVACGKGRHAIFINKMGYHIEGIDLSKDSIQYANQFANDSLDFNIHDMRSCYKKNEFDIVMNVFTSFGYFNNPIDNLKAIQSMSDNLKNGGKIVLDFMNAKKVINELVTSEQKSVEHINFNIKRSVQNGYIIKDIHFTDKQKEFHFQEKVEALTLSNFKDLFEKSGLNIINLWGDYSLNDFNALQSQRLIILAQK